MHAQAAAKAAAESMTASSPKKKKTAASGDEPSALSKSTAGAVQPQIEDQSSQPELAAQPSHSELAAQPLQPEHQPAQPSTPLPDENDDDLMKDETAEQGRSIDDDDVQKEGEQEVSAPIGAPEHAVRLGPCVRPSLSHPRRAGTDWDRSRACFSGRCEGRCRRRIIPTSTMMIP